MCRHEHLPPLQFNAAPEGVQLQLYSMILVQHADELKSEKEFLHPPFRKLAALTYLLPHMCEVHPIKPKGKSSVSREMNLQVIASTAQVVNMAEQKPMTNQGTTNE